MNTHTKQWNTVPRLPRRCSELSAAICENTLYLAGGITASSSLKGLNCPFKSVFTCSLPELLTSNTRGSRLRQPPRNNVWKEICSLPVTHSTLVSFGGHLVAIGGEDDTHISTSDVYVYNSRTDSWTVASQMNTQRSRCISAILSEDHLIVVGGFFSRRSVFSFIKLNSMEMLK